MTNKSPWNDYCEHGIPRQFCTAKHVEAEDPRWPERKYEKDNGVAAIGAALILIFFLIYMIAMLFG